MFKTAHFRWNEIIFIILVLPYPNFCKGAYRSPQNRVFLELTRPRQTDENGANDEHD